MEETIQGRKLFAEIPYLKIGTLSKNVKYKKHAPKIIFFNENFFLERLTEKIAKIGTFRSLDLERTL